MNKQDFFRKYHAFLSQCGTPEFIILYIHMPGGETEIILNPDAAAKMDYIDKKYGDDLHHTGCPDIYITDAIFTEAAKGMSFSDALDAMLNGQKVKLPSWGGYWFWDNERQTIIMHTKDGEELDIRSTDRMLYTLENICSEEWVLADESNCPQISPDATPLFSFSIAVKFLRRGLRVARAGWNGKGQYVFLATDVEFSCEADLSELSAKQDSEVQVSDMLVLRTAQGSLQPGWLASQGDILADDWYLLPDK